MLLNKEKSNEETKKILSSMYEKFSIYTFSFTYLLKKKKKN